MLKKRIIGVLILKNGIVVQSIGFNRYLPIGKVEIALNYLDRWGIDEIVMLDIDATPENKAIDFEWISSIAKTSFAPLSVGGGLRSVDDMRKLIHYGADKIIVNKEAFVNPEIIDKAASVLGSQSVVVSVDVKNNGVDGYEVYTDSGTNPTGIEPETFARKVESLGAGEILLNSIDRDGSKKGYDIDLLRRVSDSVSIPVIGCGGVGHVDHFLEAAEKTKVSGLAAANIFHFTEHSPIIVKAYLDEMEVDTRVDTHANYRNFKYDHSGRIKRRSDEYLQKLRFEKIEDEVI